MARATALVTSSNPPKPSPLINRPRMSTAPALAAMGHSHCVGISRSSPVSDENRASAIPGSPTAKYPTTRKPLTILPVVAASISAAASITIRPVWKEDRTMSRVTSSLDSPIPRHQATSRNMTEPTNSPTPFNPPYNNGWKGDTASPAFQAVSTSSEGIPSANPASPRITGVIRRLSIQEERAYAHTRDRSTSQKGIFNCPNLAR